MCHKMVVGVGALDGKKEDGSKEDVQMRIFVIDKNMKLVKLTIKA